LPGKDGDYSDYAATEAGWQTKTAIEKPKSQTEAKS
jgi:hypothetical protein